MEVLSKGHLRYMWVLKTVKDVLDKSEHIMYMGNQFGKWISYYLAFNK